MTTLTAAGQDTILMSSIFAFAANFTWARKNPNPKPNQGLYITHLKGLLEACYFYLPSASIQKHSSRNTGTNEDCFPMDLCLWLIASVSKVQALIEASLMPGNL